MKETPEQLAADPGVQKRLAEMRGNSAPPVSGSRRSPSDGCPRVPRPASYPAVRNGKIVTVIRRTPRMVEIDTLVEQTLTLQKQLETLRAKAERLNEGTEFARLISEHLSSDPRFASQLLLLRSSSRVAPVAKLRFEAIRFLHDLHIPHADIARYFNRDRTTIIFALREHP